MKDAAIWRQAIAPVFDALPPQALERLANAPRVFVVPHEFLWRVPFEALPIGDEYLGQRAAVTYLSSLSARLGAGGADAGPVIPLVAIGAPDIAPAMSLQLAQSAPDWTIRSADAATRELDAVSAGRDSEHVVRLSGATARKSAVRESLSGAGVDPLRDAVPPVTRQRLVLVHASDAAVRRAAAGRIRCGRYDVRFA